MELSNKPTSWLMVQAMTDSTTVECDYCIIEIADDWKNEILSRLRVADMAMRMDKNLSSVDYRVACNFYQDTNNIDSTDLLDGVHWSFIKPSYSDLIFLGNPQNRIPGFMLEIGKDGYASYSTHRIQANEFWTVEIDLREITESF